MNRNEVIDAYREELVSWRRDFHMHPEVGFKEMWTSNRIVEILSHYDVEIIKNFCETAVIAVVRGEYSGPVMGIRADMDALAMQDLKTVEYCSQNPGVCHSCGHDAHITVALGVVKYYSSHKDELHGTLKVVFQPAEEGPAPGGAKKVIDTGIVDDIEFMVGIHTDSSYPLGSLILRRGEMLAGSNNFHIKIQGKGGHGAYPHQTKDPMAVAVEAYQAFQLLLTREIDPVKALLMSICYFQAGTPEAPNVIPDTISLGGTIRSFDDNVREYVLKRMQAILKSVCESHGCTYEMETIQGCVVLENDDELIDIFYEAGKEVFGEEHILFKKVPEMGYDDFAYYGKKTKAAYAYIGTTRQEKLSEYIPHHHPLFDLDEDCLCLGVKLLVETIDKCMRM